MDLKTILSRLERPSKAVVTAGAYANGPCTSGISRVRNCQRILCSLGRFIDR